MGVESGTWGGNRGSWQEDLIEGQKVSARFPSPVNLRTLHGNTLPDPEPVQAMRLHAAVVATGYFGEHAPAPWERGNLAD